MPNRLTDQKPSPGTTPAGDMNPPLTRRGSRISFARRRWVFRTTALLALTAVALCFFVAWRRDRMTIQSQLDAMNGAVAELQSQVDSLGLLPAIPPILSRGGFNYYVSDADRYYASQTSEPMIVAVTGTETLVFKGAGRAVLVYDKGKISAKWMSENEYEDAWLEQEHKIDAFERERRAQPITLP